MQIKSLCGYILLTVLVIAPHLAAQDYGTADEAKAMLMRAVEALKQDKAGALAAFSNGDERFREKDLYVFCFDGKSGEVLAHGAKKSLIGDNVRTKKDAVGKPHGEALFQNAVEGKFNEVQYMLARPGEEKPSAKSSFITKVMGTACGVGYYK